LKTGAEALKEALANAKRLTRTDSPEARLAAIAELESAMRLHAKNVGTNAEMPKEVKKLAIEIRKKMEESASNELTDSLQARLCALGADPVNLITGAMQFDVTDFELPGPIPLVWNRSWYSDSRLVGHMGHGTRHSYEMGMDIYENKLTRVYLSDGRAAIFPLLSEGEEHFNYKETLSLRHEEGKYILFDPATRYYYRFTKSEGGYLPYKLNSITNAQNHKIAFGYDKGGYLSSITDSVGRELTVTTDEKGQITQVATDNQPLVRYKYNNTQDMTEITDAAGQTSRIEYQNHLIVKKTDRNGNSFYWQYEDTPREKPDCTYKAPRVIKTWGDGNVLSYNIVYHDRVRFNVVTNSLGHETVYHYNRFRYYSPSDGIYTQQDPIGLEGNNPTLYAYVHNPLVWVDPFGLNPFCRITGERVLWTSTTQKIPLNA
jgi:RHS repeat-associated protein